MAKKTSIVDTVVSLCKRRGFVFPTGEIYGGTRSAWDYGPLGVELKENIKRQWWQYMVRSRDDVVGLDSSVILPRQVWEAAPGASLLTLAGNPVAAGQVVPGDIVVQTKQTLDNLMSVLDAAGATAKNIVNMRVILRNVADFPRFNETFREYFAGEKVTRTCFGGVLHRAGTDVEIDCVAMFD